MRARWLLYISTALGLAVSIVIFLGRLEIASNIFLFDLTHTNPVTDYIYDLGIPVTIMLSAIAYFIDLRRKTKISLDWLLVVNLLIIGFVSSELPWVVAGWHIDLFHFLGRRCLGCLY